MVRVWGLRVRVRVHHTLTPFQRVKVLEGKGRVWPFCTLPVTLLNPTSRAWVASLRSLITGSKGIASLHWVESWWLSFACSELNGLWFMARVVTYVMESTSKSAYYYTVLTTITIHLKTSLECFNPHQGLSLEEKNPLTTALFSTQLSALSYSSSSSYSISNTRTHHHDCYCGIFSNNHYHNKILRSRFPQTLSTPLLIFITPLAQRVGSRHSYGGMQLTMENGNWYRGCEGSVRTLKAP